LADFKIFETTQFLQDLEQDFKGQQDKIKSKLTHYVYPQLRENPYFGKNIKKLKNYEPQTWRYRIRGFRFFFEINDHKKIVSMISADNREGAY
jgi:mRNA interferase RelE/StbE